MHGAGEDVEARGVVRGAQCARATCDPRPATCEPRTANREPRTPNMTHPPVIGITRCSRLDDYVASIEQSGGRPRILEVSDSPRKVVGEIHGLVLTGGGDVDPVLYREDRHETIVDAEPGRDEFEIDLARRAMDTGLAVLAICRGAQVLEHRRRRHARTGHPLRNRHYPRPLDRSAEGRDRPRGDVTPGSRLEQALGASVSASHTCRVNSRHHQSIARLGRSLAASAKAPDGVVEAIESSDAEFCIGVQWHPENFWRTGEFAGLFESFITAAKKRSLAP